MRNKSRTNNQEKDRPRTGAEENDGFPEMMDENWKPSFKEVAESKSWKEHLIAYFATFGTILYLIASPKEWKGWTAVVLGAAALTIGYWAAMINFNRCYLRKANRQLLQERRRLERLEHDLQEETRKLERDSTSTTRETPDKQFIQ